jgi:hypothetical protein
MKQILLSLTFLCLIGKTFGQKLSQTPTLTKDYYLSKSKTQKTIGWVMLGGGIAMTTVGLILLDKESKKNEWYDPIEYTVNTGGSQILAGLGIVTSLSSIIFFTSSAKNARKAALISFKNQKVLFLQQNAFAFKAQPALTLTIKL